MIDRSLHRDAFPGLEFHDGAVFQHFLRGDYSGRTERHLVALAPHFLKQNADLELAPTREDERVLLFVFGNCNRHVQQRFLPQPLVDVKQRDILVPTGLGPAVLNDLDRNYRRIDLGARLQNKTKTHL